MTRVQDDFLGSLGRELTPALFAQTAARYAPRALRPDPAHCRVLRDIAYGEDPRHRLDLFLPVAPGAPRPVLLYVHGGGFVRGDKGGADSPYYANLGAWAATQGFIGATMNYRLAPGARWPSGPEDIARALTWLSATIGAEGGDPAALVLMGQSAGAVHVSGYVAGHHGSPSPRLAGAVMLSGIYDLTTLTHSDYERAYFGDDPATFATQSSLPALVASDLPMLFTVAELDPLSFQDQAAQLVAAFMATRRHWPRLHYLGGQNHVSALYQLGLEEDTLGPLLADFIRFATGR